MYVLLKRQRDLGSQSSLLPLLLLHPLRELHLTQRALCSQQRRLLLPGDYLPP